MDTSLSQFEAASAAVARLTLRQNHSSAPNNVEVIQQMLKGCSLNVSPPRSTFGLSDPLTMWHQGVQGSYDHENLISLLRTDRLEKSKMLPPDYICHLCWEKGHFIKDCLLVNPASIISKESFRKKKKIIQFSNSFFGLGKAKKQWYHPIPRYQTLFWSI